MRVAVVGAGAMGSIFGARFQQGGLETVLVDVSEPLVEKLNADGVCVVRGEEEHVERVPATTDPSSAGEQDLVVFFVKCYHTAAAAKAAAPLVGPNTVVASLQNGWGNGDVLAEVFAPERVAVGVTYNSGTVLELGKVAHPGVGPTYVGSYADGADGGGRVAEALEAGGLEVVASPSIRQEIWKKLILNAATLPTAALTGMNAGSLTAHPLMHELVSEVGREAVEVAQALGFDIDADERVEYIHALSTKAGPTKASMLQDFEAGRRTEIDVINGAVLRAAEEKGIDVPLNRAFVALVKGWESMRGLS